MEPAINCRNSASAFGLGGDSPSANRRICFANPPAELRSAEVRPLRGRSTGAFGPGSPSGAGGSADLNLILASAFGLRSAEILLGGFAPSSPSVNSPPLSGPRKGPLGKRASGPLPFNQREPPKAARASQTERSSVCSASN